MIEYNDKGEITKPVDGFLRNSVTSHMFEVRDVRVLKKKDKYYIASKYNDLINKSWEVSNWIVEEENPNLITPDRNDDRFMVTFDVEISRGMDIVNILLVSFMINNLGSTRTFVTSAKKQAYDRMNKLKKKPHIPLQWRYVDELLEFVGKTRLEFIEYIGTDEAKRLMKIYI